MDDQTLRTLIVDDSEDDALLIIRALKRGGYDPVYERVQTAASMKKVLKEKQWDVILCDYKMPKFNAPSAIRLLKETNIDIPLIIISGTIGEETAVECMRLGARDYFMKGNLSLLCSAIARELEEAEIREKQKQAEEKLRAWMNRYELIVAASGHVAYEYDVPTGYITWGSSIEQVLGYTIEEISGGFIQWQKLLHPEDREAILEALEASMNACAFWDAQYRLRHKRGNYVWIRDRGFFLPDAEGKAYSQLGMLEDITGRKQVEEALRKSEELYTRLVDSIPDIIVHTDLEGKILFINDYGVQISGYSRGEIEGHNMLEFFPSEEHKSLIQETALMLERRLGPREYNLLAKDERKIPLEINGDILRNEDGTPFGFVTVSRDISERRQAESQREALLEKLRDSERKLREAQEMAHLGHWTWDVKTGQVEWSAEVFKIFQLDPDSFTPRIDSIQDLSPWPEDHERDKELIRKTMENHESGSYEQRFLRPDKSIGYYFSTYQGKYDNNGNLVSIVGTVQDITERKHTEMAIAGMNRALLMRSNTDKVLIHIADEAMLLTEVCRIIVEVGGYLMAWVGFAEQDEAKTVRPVAHAGLDSGYIESAKITWADNERGRGPGGTAIRTGQMCIVRNIPLDPSFASWREAAIERGYKSTIALPLVSEGQTFGELTIYSAEADAFDAKEVEILKEMADDLAFGITVLRIRVKQDQTAVALHESEERYRLIAENTADTIAVFNLNFNQRYVSPATLKLRGYTVEETMTQTLDQMLTPDSLQQARKMLADQIALESSTTADPARTALIELEEYCKDGSTIWVELAVSFLRDKNLNPTGILTLTRNITERKQSEEKLQQTLDSLRNAVSTTIKVLVSALEVRDPYTAGHQLRVADLARAIATEMGLDQEKIDGIRMAGSIHDIGKLSIPAEILSKPTQLTNLEFSLIKEHSQHGYEMLKDVDSPWPLAQIVYQHHERMNGTGYPQKLKGDGILLEARIMAVADVVEAMASHRPYRAGLGIDVALEEIEKNKGMLYDDAVADACLRLFREKGYNFS